MKSISKIFKALADSNRLRIIKLLEKRKMCVCELAFVLGIKQPSVSRHLKKMIEWGIVGSEQDGFYTNYFLLNNNRYAKTILFNLSEWLNEEPIIKKDIVKSRQADRKKIVK